MKCKDRIKQAMNLKEKTENDLSYELFVHRKEIRKYLKELIHDGLVFRKFVPDKITKMPGYVYSTVRFPSRYRQLVEPPKDLIEVVGDWDSIDMKKVKR